MLVEDAYQFFDEFIARELVLSGTKLSDQIIFYGYDYHPFTSFFLYVCVCVNHVEKIVNHDITKNNILLACS